MVSSATQVFIRRREILVSQTYYLCIKDFIEVLQSPFRKLTQRTLDYNYIIFPWGQNRLMGAGKFLRLA